MFLVSKVINSQCFKV